MLLDRGVEKVDDCSRAILAAAIFCASFDNGLGEDVADSSTTVGVDTREGVEEGEF